MKLRAGRRTEMNPSECVRVTNPPLSKTINLTIRGCNASSFKVIFLHEQYFRLIYVEFSYQNGLLPSSCRLTRLGCKLTTSDQIYKYRMVLTVEKKKCILMGGGQLLLADHSSGKLNTKKLCLLTTWELILSFAVVGIRLSQRK